MNTVKLDGVNVIPNKLVCIGRNYVEHIAELGNEVPDEMVIFLKPNSAITTELVAFDQEQLHYEAEICFLYQNGKFSAVGFGLDLTKRQLQTKLKGKGLPWERAKSFNGSALFSEFIAIRDSDQSFSLDLKIDSHLVQTGGVDLMMYKPEKILAEIQTFMSLEEGDIVMTGTPKGVGAVHKSALFEGTIKINQDVLVEASWIAK